MPADIYIYINTAKTFFSFFRSVLLPPAVPDPVLVLFPCPHVMGAQEGEPSAEDPLPERPRAPGTQLCNLHTGSFQQTFLSHLRTKTGKGNLKPEVAASLLPTYSYLEVLPSRRVEKSDAGRGGPQPLPP